MSKAGLDLSKIIFHDFHDREFVKEKKDKNQIVLHHTVSGKGVGGDVNWWLKDKKRIGTSFLIANDGEIHQVFNSAYWAYHLGLKSSHFQKEGLSYKDLNPTSIGIEIDSWGGLVKHSKDGLWYPAKWSKQLRMFVPNFKSGAVENVVEYPEGYRDFYGFERYTDEQIASTAALLIYLAEKYDIPLEYNADMWDVSKEALTGKSGIWTHTSYRRDKSDCHPQAELIEMLKSLA